MEDRSILNLEPKIIFLDFTNSLPSLPLSTTTVLLGVICSLYSSVAVVGEKELVWPTMFSKEEGGLYCILL